LVISGGRDINGFDKSNFSFLGQSSIDRKSTRLNSSH
jgi:hypothetical protein